MENRTLTCIPGVEVGHATDLKGGTGCTAVLVPGGATAAAAFRGGAIAARQVNVLQPGHVTGRVHGIVLTGGSAFGLDATGGVMRVLEARGAGLATPAGVVPICPTLALFDLGCGDATVRPDAQMGSAAAAAASSAPVAEGTVGAGTGATVGKLRGMAGAVKGGVGTWALAGEGGLLVAALVAVNAFGDVRDPDTGELVAGARDATGRVLGARTVIESGALRDRMAFADNTTLAVVGTNARLGHGAVGRAAALAANAMPACIDPVHTMLDGDAVVGFATGAVDAEPHQVGLLWERVLRVAILRAVREACALHGVPAACALPPVPRDAPTDG